MATREEIIIKEWDSTPEEYQLAITLSPPAEKIGRVMEEYKNQECEAKDKEIIDILEENVKLYKEIERLVNRVKELEARDGMIIVK